MIRVLYIDCAPRYFLFTCEGYRVFLASAGEACDDDDWWFTVSDNVQSLTVQQIQEMQQQQNVTQCYIEGNMPPNLDQLLPHLSALCVAEITVRNMSSLDW